MKLNEVREELRVFKELVVGTLSRGFDIGEHPKIKRIGRSMSAYTINVNDLENGMILSAFYYDFKAQYEAIMDVVKKCGTTESAIGALSEIVRTKKTKGQKFHPKMVDKTKELLNEKK